MRALGIDLGERRIGLALSDATGTLARPWKAVENLRPDSALAGFFADLVARLQAEDDSLGAVVVGHPRRLDGTPNGLTGRAEALATALRARVSIPVVLQDERLSSREAESRLALEHRDWRERKRLLDAASAAVILQDYLDQGMLSKQGSGAVGQ
ncbi:MAG: Holliday junction resolvase RuvX [Vicinamibacterales bacterium]